MKPIKYLCNNGVVLLYYIDYNNYIIKRHISTELNTLISEYPVVTILGPRQAGKTTLTKTLTGYGYSNLEIPETRNFAIQDPKAYLSGLPEKAVIDEIQRVPELLSYIQAKVDQNDAAGQYILTGSYQLKLREAVSQSLAGRTAILHLFPLSIAELKEYGINFSNFQEYCFKGFLPAIHAKDIRPGTAYANYYQTYVERDVRQLINLKDATQFENFLKLLAGRTGQIMDYNSIAGDTGVSPKTIKNWLSILEASFIVIKLSPYFNNFGKRVIKSPKYFFTDTGLLCYLLGIRNAEQVVRDPLVGSIFENMAVLECLKTRFNAGLPGDLYFFRDSNGNEIDLLFKEGGEITAVEIKSAATFSSSLLTSLKRFSKITDRSPESYLIYSGEEFELSDNIHVLNFRNSNRIFNIKRGLLKTAVFRSLPQM